MRILEQICAELGLGRITEPPRQLSGGFLHRMFSLFTERGRFAVKLLNPGIMARPTALANYRAAEALEDKLERANLPILPALRLNGRKMQQIAGQYYYLFEFFEGRALPSPEILPEHCRIIGGHLAGLHAIDRRAESVLHEPIQIDWYFYADKLANADDTLDTLFRQNLAMLNESRSLANAALPRLPAATAICHNDMDSKNVLWQNGQPRIIDLECLGRGNPQLELYETALCWSGIEECNVDARRFAAFIQSYRDADGVLPEDWTVIHDANTGRLGWLEYNLRRALGMEGAPEERALGVSESIRTLGMLAHYRQIRDRL